ncbi:MAG: TniQ family protein [Trichlorobacter sp.]
MTKLVFKVRAENRYAGLKFPLRLRPLEDELLSSWLIRLAILHRTMPMTFTNLYLPHTKNKLWSSDLDLQADGELLAGLSVKAAGIPVEQLHSITLKSYEGYLFERVYWKTRATQFILPLEMRGRRATLPGLRFCPECLRSDPQPYFRKIWRVSLSTVCTVHNRYLHDRCPHCSTPLTPYISCQNGRMTDCYKCRMSLVQGRASPSSAPDELVVVTNRLVQAFKAGVVVIGGKPIYSHLYFRVLHHVLRMLMSGKWGARLRSEVGLEWVGDHMQTFERVLIQDQARLIEKAVWLLDDWPKRFVDLCQRQGIWSSALLHDVEDAPFWYWDVVIRELYRPDRVVSEEEIKAAIAYMEGHGMPVNERSLSRLLGVNQVFRKRSLGSHITKWLSPDLLRQAPD